MSVYRLRLEFVSPPGTRPAADTLFGHICWGLVYEQGPDVLREFLRFMDGPNPPLVISDPMPADHWPMPPLPAPPPKAYEQLIDETQLNGPWSGCDRRAAVDRIGMLAETDWVPSDIFALAVSDLSTETLLRKLIRWEREIPGPPRAAVIPRGQVNRLSGTVEADAHYDRIVHADGPMNCDVYASSPWPAERVLAVFEQGLSCGYGRRASIGMGHVRCASIVACELPGAGSPNAVLALGAFAPRGTDPSDGYWRLTTRLGKLGGPWATDDQVHKFPLVFLRGGAVLRAHTPAGVLGRMVHGVHPERPEVQQYGLTVGIPVKLAE